MFRLSVDENTYIHLIQIQHANELFELINQNRKHLRRWLPWVDNMVSPMDCHSIIPMWIEQFVKNNGFHGGIRYKEKLVGMIGLHYIDWQNRKTSIGYYLAKKYEGKGIVTKSVSTVLHYIFEELHLNRVEIRCGVNNNKSRAIPERLGFQKEGVLREEEWLHHQFHDIALYSMLQKDWHIRKNHMC
ncbi:GNAT family N-acetyltransferase [Bacillus alveayuensis]|jgi:ribosomal-protein-serine acetyltransferase|uniref:Ribosomal-protein-serine acetyltransferase n=1 Tax=Aeribacillus alveayuensis TaxID=279215 RepID=A0ABT9VM93_9BACI|nr:GNAT family protein [Bacillus alveayuensis]MDQ0162102.1 ribosomal-protein-serine acetyltransferase [Bacillus alveayuensis]